ncbi:MAG: T9SS type A sorting domain-containing protein [Bacteroidia bacterium]
MQRFVYLFLFLFLSLPLSAQRVEWIKQIDAPLRIGAESLFKVHSTKDGHFYLTGKFVDSLSYGDTLLFPIMSSSISASQEKALSMKGTPEGSINRFFYFDSKGIGATLSYREQLLDQDENIWYVGGFAGDSLSLADTTLISIPSSRFSFALQLDSLGQKQSLLYDDRLFVPKDWRSIDVMGEKRAISGTFFGPTIAFNDTIITIQDSANPYQNHHFIAIFDLMNKLQSFNYFKRNSNTLYENKSIALDPLGGFFSIINYEDTIQIDTFTAIAQGPRGILLTHWDDSGQLDWIQNWDGINSERAYDLRVDSKGNALILARINDNTLIQSTTITKPLNSVHDQFTCLLKVDRNGQIQWTVPLDIQLNSYVNINLNKQDEIFISGYFIGKGQIGPFRDNSIILNPIEISPYNTSIIKLFPNGRVCYWQYFRGEVSQAPLFFRNVSTDTTGHFYSLLMTNLGRLDSLPLNNGAVFYAAESNQNHALVRFRDCKIPMATSGPTDLCVGDSISLSFTTPFIPQNTYQWFRNWDTIIGANTNVLAVDSPGVYSVLVQDSFCHAFASPIEVRHHPYPAAPSILGDSVLCAGDTLWGPAGFIDYTWADGSQNAWFVPQSNGIPHLKVGNYGCFSPKSDDFKYELNPLPDTPDILFISNDSLQSSINAANYRWFRNGQLLGDSSVSILSALSGLYQVQILQGTCWSELSDPYSHFATDITNDIEGGITIYPNPNEGVFSIQFPLNIYKTLALKLYNLHGQIVWEQKLFTQAHPSAQISLPNHLKGVYLLQVQNERHSWYKKIIIQ